MENANHYAMGESRVAGGQPPLWTLFFLVPIFYLILLKELIVHAYTLLRPGN